MVTQNMEVKEAILQTLAELDSATKENETTDENLGERDALLQVLDEGTSRYDDAVHFSHYQRKIEKLDYKNSEELKNLLTKFYQEEEKFLDSLQERILVLFEGLQSPNNRNIETKVDMILNFLEFTLAIIDEKKNSK